MRRDVQPGLAARAAAGIAAAAAIGTGALAHYGPSDLADADRARAMVLAGAALGVTVGTAVAATVFSVLRPRGRAAAEAESSAGRLRHAFGATGTVGWERDLLTRRVPFTSGDAERAETEELRVSSERYRALVTASTEIVFRASADGAEFVAPRWYEITGQSPEETNGGGWAAAVHPDDRETVRRRWQQSIDTGQPFEAEYRLRHEGGAYRWMHERAVALLHADGTVREWVGAVADVDDRRRAHDVLVAARGELAQRVALRTHELEEANLELRAMVAQRVPADAALRESEARFRAATEGSLDSFYLLKTVRADGARTGPVTDLAFVDCNARGLTLAKRSREQLIGRTLRELFPPRVADRLFERWARVADTGHALEEEFDVADWGLDARWLRIQVVPVGDGVAVTSRDISERRQVESALMESERRFRDLLGNVRLVAVALDAGGRVTFCNAALLELTGLERDALMGADWFTACGVDDDGALRAMFQATVPAGELPSHFESVITARGGERRVIAWNNTVLRDAAGGVIGTASLGADITDQKRYERGLRESKDAAELARLRAEEASRAKSEFLARMSHELRTPLNSVIGFSTVLLRNTGNSLSAQDVVCAERINASGRHLLGVINDILDIAKVEAGRMTLDVAPVRLGALVRGTVEQFEAHLADRDVTLALEVPPGDARLDTDAAKLQQVLINLVGNALKFTERGTVTVRVTADPATGAPTRIEVSDTGVGIPPDRLGAIFDAFEQADNSTTRRFGGTGLGLAISRSLCELMGYELRVESALGKGSTFSILLAA
jgi:PAS domain S-box-containing protein